MQSQAAGLNGLVTNSQRAKHTLLQFAVATLTVNKQQVTVRILFDTGSQGASV